MHVSLSKLIAASVLLMALGVAGVASGITVAVTSGGAPRYVLAGVCFLFGFGLLLAGMYLCATRRRLIERAVARWAGIDGRRIMYRDVNVIVPVAARRANPAVAKATIRLLARANDEKVPSYARIVNSLLTPTDAATVFGPHLDDFAFRLSQVVGRIEDRDVERLLALVRTGELAPDLCIEYIRAAGSIEVALWAIRENIAPSYLEVLV